MRTRTNMPDKLHHHPRMAAGMKKHPGAGHIPELRGLGLYITPCGILTRNEYRARHNWVTVDKASGARKHWGEDYDGATRHGVDVEAWLLLELS